MTDCSEERFGSGGGGVNGGAGGSFIHIAAGNVSPLVCFN